MEGNTCVSILHIRGWQMVMKFISSSLAGNGSGWEWCVSSVPWHHSLRGRWRSLYFSPSTDEVSGADDRERGACGSTLLSHVRNWKAMETGHPGRCGVICSVVENTVIGTYIVIAMTSLIWILARQFAHSASAGRWFWGGIYSTCCMYKGCGMLPCYLYCFAASLRDARFCRWVCCKSSCTRTCTSHTCVTVVSHEVRSCVCIASQSCLLCPEVITRHCLALGANHQRVSPLMRLLLTLQGPRHVGRALPREYSKTSVAYQSSASRPPCVYVYCAMLAACVCTCKLAHRTDWGRFTT